MIRADENLAFMLQYENVAWYEDGKVRILDRRIYPAKVEFVAQAIADMVTQSAGPYLAAGMGMALAAYECRNKTGEEAEQYLEKAADTLAHARPTTAARMEAITEKCRQVGIEALKKGERMDEAIFLHTLDEINQK